MIQVGFSHKTGFWSFLSKFIMWATGRPFSHCWLLLDEEHSFLGVPVVIEESEQGGLHAIPWAGYDRDKVIFAILTPPQSLEPGVKDLLSKLGTGYDFAGLVGEGVVVAFLKILKRKIKNPLRVASRLWCSEAVAYVMTKSPGYENLAQNSWQNCNPGDVYDALQGKSVDPVA
jgi:hypothetical protein